MYLKILFRSFSIYRTYRAAFLTVIVRHHITKLKQQLYKKNDSIKILFLVYYPHRHRRSIAGEIRKVT